MPLRCITCITDANLDPWATGASQLTKGPKMDHKATKKCRGNHIMEAFFKIIQPISTLYMPLSSSLHLIGQGKSQGTKLDFLAIGRDISISAIQGANLSTCCLEFSPGASIGTIHIQDRTPSFQVALVNLKAE